MQFLIKNGYENFKLEILEYIAFDCKISLKEKRKILTEREQYYLDLLKPEYNILKTAGSRLGAKHSPKTKKLIREKSVPLLLRSMPAGEGGPPPCGAG